MHRTVVFQSKYPDEWQFDDRGNPLVPGSRKLADDFAAALARRKCDVSPVSQHSYYGWDFNSRYDGRTFYNVLNPASGECYLTVSLSWYRLMAVLGKKPRSAFDAYCGVVDSVVQSLPNLSDPYWHEYQS